MKFIKIFRYPMFTILYVIFVPFLLLGQNTGIYNDVPQGFRMRFQNFENQDFLKKLDFKSKNYNKKLDWYLPKTLKPDQKDEVVTLLKKLKKACPNCIQAPVVSTEIPKLHFNDQFTYRPMCPLGKKFDSKLGICTIQKNNCDVPGWMINKIPFLEKAVKISDFQKRYFKNDPCKMILAKRNMLYIY